MIFRQNAIITRYYAANFGLMSVPSGKCAWGQLEADGSAPS